MQMCRGDEPAFPTDLEFTAILKVTAVSHNSLFKENDPTHSHMENAYDHSLNDDQEKNKNSAQRTQIPFQMPCRHLHSNI